MKKILKLCLMTTVLASCGCIDAMATTTHTVKGARASGGTHDSNTNTDIAGAIIVLPANHTLTNIGTNLSESIDVFYDEGSSSAYTPGALIPAEAANETTGGLVSGCIVRHHKNAKILWGNDVSGRYTNSAEYGICSVASDNAYDRGFIAGVIGIGDQSKFYESIDYGTDELYKLYRETSGESNDKISGTVHLEKDVNAGWKNFVTSSQSSTSNSPYYGYTEKGAAPNLVYCHNASSATFKSAFGVASAFVIDLSKDGDARAGIITANLLNGNGKNNDTDIDSLSIINTNSCTLSFTGENNFAGYDPTKGAGLGDPIALNIGDASTAGNVTFGGSEDSDNGADAAMKGIGNVTVANGGSVLTLEKGKSTIPLTTAGDWTFYGTSTLASRIPMVIAAGNKITFGAS